jgi:NAD(P)-dependent dehydrogenase (short-subunit alcohol dehydrogenase family)
MGVLDGRVVIVTGAGRGIGRETALLAAKEGAKVLVNDLGAAMSGADEGGAGPAQDVVNEIKAAGGEAIANTESVASMASVKAMVEQARDAFGGLHAVISPAGILRDGMFHKMSEDDWDAVIAVHLRGTFNICRATIELFRDQQDGAYVLFTSTAGLIGSIGQANYAAAKLGIVGLSRTIAMEGAAKNVRSNIIAPFAWTRMLQSIPVKDEASALRVKRMREGMRSDQPAQLAVALAAAPANVTGQIFSVRGNEIALFSQPRPIHKMTMTAGWSPQAILDTAMPAMTNDFTALGGSASVFNYDPV